MNLCILKGRLGADPETKTINSGSTITTFSLATSKKWTSKSGEKQEKTNWHRCKAWNKTGEVIEKYFSKGSEIIVTGEIEYGKYDGNDGVTRYTTDIIVNSFEFTSGSGSNTNSPAKDTGEDFGPPPTTDDNEEIPF